MNAIVIDGNSLITRHIMATALDDLKAGGLWTGGVYGTLSSLAKTLRMPGFRAGPIYAFFDCGVPPQRLKLVETLEGAGYKSERKERREMLSEEDKEKAFEQMHTSRKMLELLGVSCIAYKDREADDCVAAAAKLLEDWNPIVISGDKDLWQTVQYGARVWDLGKKHFIDAENFFEEVGVPLDCYLLYKAILGDPSDCIKGVHGCGEKYSRNLILEFEEDLAGKPPHDQVYILEAKLKQRTKPRKYEASFLESAETLHTILDVIDLSNSFGATAGLWKRLQDVQPFEKMKFLKFCKRLQFNSVLGNPDRFITPFWEAAERREMAEADG